MKKYLPGFMLLLVTLSFNAFSGNQVCYPTGPNQWTCIEYYTPGNLGAFGPPGNTVNNGMTTNSTTYSNEAYAAKQAAESAAKKAEAEAKKKYCKDNGYPASAPFCAEQKDAKNKCLQASNASSLLCELDAAQILSDKVYSCSFVIFNDNALAQCNLAATTDNAARLKVCSVNKTLGDDYCNNNF
jgi:hypothetical protein